MTTYLLKLYLSGKTPQSQKAMKNLTAICESVLPGNYDIEQVDILKSPGVAERDKIFATPTVVRFKPEPSRMVIGDLSNRSDVLDGLDIISDEDPR